MRNLGAASMQCVPIRFSMIYSENSVYIIRRVYIIKRIFQNIAVFKQAFQFVSYSFLTSGNISYCNNSVLMYHTG